MFAGMRLGQAGQACVRGLLILTIILTSAVGASGQTQPAPVPAVLTNIAVADDGNEVRLTFSPLTPRFSVVKDNSDTTAVGFALSSRATSTALPSRYAGHLRSISVEQQDTVLIVRFFTDTAVKVVATPAGQNSITISLRPTMGTAPATSAYSPAPPAQLQPYTAPKPGEDGFEVIPLKYADVSEVVGLLASGISVKPNDSFTPREPDFGSAGMGGTATYTPAPPANELNSDEPLGQSINGAIGIDRRLNAIVLHGSPDQIARLRAQIAQIDVPVQSVILETTFVELTESGARNVGLDFNNTNAQIGVATFQTGAFIPPGLPTDKNLSSVSFQAALYAQVTNGNGKIISKPRIAAQSGSSARIITGDALPILTSIALSGVNGVQQQVQYVNVGVTLQIAPRVTSDGFVTSHVFCVVSSVTGFSQGYPTISQRKAETSATVADGETFVIGGLTEHNELATTSSVPLLGDIPLLGRLFTLNKGTDSKTELYIVVTPHIVHPKTDPGNITPP
jgi:general secretion pathway protein D